MGLDMYLEAERYIGGWKHDSDEERALFATILSAAEMPPEKVSEHAPSLGVSVNVGYWRKSNQVHKWFVDNAQDGEDKCQRSYVDREKLVELRKLCQEALAAKDSEKLPPQGGFFFGSTEIDEWYWSDLEHTVAILDRALALPECWSFYYRASW